LYVDASLVKKPLAVSAPSVEAARWIESRPERLHVGHDYLGFVPRQISSGSKFSSVYEWIKTELDGKAGNDANERINQYTDSMTDYVDIVTTLSKTRMCYVLAGLFSPTTSSSNPPSMRLLPASAK